MNYDAPADVAKLKAHLLWFLTKELNQFAAATGLTPSLIVVRMIENTTHGDRVRKYMPSEVEIRFDL